MKRTAFLRRCLALFAWAAVPSPASSKPTQGQRSAKGFMVGAGRDRFDKSLKMFETDTFYTKVATSDTDGDFFLFESTRIEEGGPALHVHYDQDEWWYVLEGTFLFRVGDEMFEAKQGDSVFGPRRVPHTFSKTGKDPGRMLLLYQPAGGMEAYFKAVSEGLLKQMSVAEQDAFRKKHGFERIGPAIGRLKQ